MAIDVELEAAQREYVEKSFPNEFYRRKNVSIRLSKENRIDTSQYLVIGILFHSKIEDFLKDLGFRTTKSKDDESRVEKLIQEKGLNILKRVFNLIIDVM